MRLLTTALAALLLLSACTNTNHYRPLGEPGPGEQPEVIKQPSQETQTWN